MKHQIVMRTAAAVVLAAAFFGAVGSVRAAAPVDIRNVPDCEVMDIGVNDTLSAAKIGDKLYPTIEAALAEAQPDETVTVLQDAQLESLTIPDWVRLDLNGKTVTAEVIENNGTIVVYDAATVIALTDVPGIIEFAVEVMVSDAYIFPAGTEVEFLKNPGIPVTEIGVLLPEDGIIMNGYGAAAMQVISVYPGEGVSGLVLEGVMERGAYDCDTQIIVNGACVISGPLVIGADGEGVDYETYPDNKAILAALEIGFPDVQYGGDSQITLIPERGEIQTLVKLVDNENVPKDCLVTVDGAKIVETLADSGEGVVYIYTAEWDDDPWKKIRDEKVDGFDALEPEQRQAAQVALDTIAEVAAEGATGDEVLAKAADWIAKVYGEAGKIPAVTLAAAKNVGISVKYDLPLMTAQTPTIEIRQALDEDEKPVDGGFTFQIIDGADPVSLAAAEDKLQSMVLFTTGLEEAFDQSEAKDVKVVLSQDKLSATATFTKVTPAGFMKVELVAPAMK